MKNSFFFLTFLFFFSCSSENREEKHKPDVQKSEVALKEIQKNEIQEILDSAKMKGTILIYDLDKSTYFSNDFLHARKGQLPASTFKIPNSMIALETAVVENKETFFEWDGEPRAFKMWERDFLFKDAFKFSCVPCYQDIARRVGVERMNAWLSKLNYGNEIMVDTTNLDLFWLTGDWRITPFEEIDFLHRLYDARLPISKRTENIVKEMMIMEQNEAYTLRGKTGWSVDDGIDNGWFVGYLEKAGKVFFFATNVEPDPSFDMKDFPRVRKEITLKALKKLGVL